MVSIIQDQQQSFGISSPSFIRGNSCNPKTSSISNSDSSFQEFNQFTITFKGNHIITKFKITDGHRRAEALKRIRKQKAIIDNESENGEMENNLV
jgi:hypothetical protein